MHIITLNTHKMVFLQMVPHRFQRAYDFDCAIFNLRIKLLIQEKPNCLIHDFDKIV